ncbi:sulfotransferase family protein [Maritalea myrionectae]|uniref:sulfotransferase family protein n=1 Tax=Maritalea myrionectae TaxID=454601 RepID=UPI00041D9192|nr:sulfotransferase [Maritalea myrionectae]
MTVSLPFVPVIIIGAARSGTNILRDCLTGLEGFETWDCDEINPIWRHGNLTYPNDEIPVEKATENVKSYVRNQFIRLWKEKGRPRFVVEKTCANSLRVPFVHTIFPEAKFVFIVRDGIDVIASSKHRWKGELELPKFNYFYSKAKYAPKLDLPWYAASFIQSRIGLIAGNKKNLRSWGPRFEGMDGLAEYSLEELCATQWVICVEKAMTDLHTVPNSNVHSLKYENLVSDPGIELEKISRFLEYTTAQKVVSDVAKQVRNNSVGKGKEVYGALPSRIKEIVEPTRRKLNYEFSN